MKESEMQMEDYPDPVSEKKSKLLARAKNLGEILRKHPNIQSNSPELYVLGYLENLGSHKV